ncbi:MAG: translation initiation factor IF-2 [Planctomycetes bacterium]|nr:translation initiation factor IF-2 [Planctomycetota bacterium]
MKTRLFQVARELKARCAELVTIARNMGVSVVDHLSFLSDTDVLSLRTMYRVEKGMIKERPPEKPKARAGEGERGKKAGEAATARPAVATAAPGATKEGAKAAERKGLTPTPTPGAETEEDERKKTKTFGKGSRRTFDVVASQPAGRGPVRGGQRAPVRRGPRETLSAREAPPKEEGPEVDPNKVFEVALPITVKDLSGVFGVKVSEIIARMLRHGRMLRINDPLDQDSVETVALEFERNVTFKRSADVEETLAKEFGEFKSAAEALQRRAPIVTVLGHVDHGKTTILDKFRGTDKAAHEAGGITQHMEAFRIEGPRSSVVFVDTPGHEAFSAMRARGSQVTDIVILVVAADDGVMPQTKEAISHAKAAGVPIVVAINKIDKPTANVDRTKAQLANAGLALQGWGGEVECIPCSAVTGDGLQNLVDTLIVTAEVLDLKADAARPAFGTVLEGHVDPERGVTANVLVQGGTLKKGDVVLAGACAGRVRLLRNDKGKVITEAGPSTPVEVFGFPEAPAAGDRLYVLPEFERALELANRRRERRRMEAQATSHVSLGDLFLKKKKELNLVVKADVQGSAEVLKKEIGEIEAREVKVKIIHGDVGGINDSDVTLADASDAVIIGFNVVASESAQRLAKARNVEVRVYQVLYQAIDDLKAALEGMLEPKEEEVVTGEATILQVFHASRVGNIAGCKVTSGAVERNAKVRLVRDNIIVSNEVELASLRRQKDDVREVREGFECGMKLRDFDDIKTGDRLQFYKITKVRQRLEPAK